MASATPNPGAVWEDKARLAMLGSRPGKGTPEPSMSFQGAWRAVRGEPWLIFKASKVLWIISPHASRPPDVGCRRYHRPEPMTRRAEGSEDVVLTREVVRVVLRYGSLGLAGSHPHSPPELNLQRSLGRCPSLIVKCQSPVGVLLPVADPLCRYCILSAIHQAYN